MARIPTTMVRLKGSRVVPDLAVYAFQFHDGSIKGHIAPIKAVFLWYFNSTMVRLKELRWKRWICAKTFQFHDGSIKGCLSVTPSTELVKFQFHDGSIKGEIKWMYLKKSNWFQFHDGSIKGICQHTNPWSLTHFNSTMVRLKES